MYHLEFNDCSIILQWSQCSHTPNYTTPVGGHLLYNALCAKNILEGIGTFRKIVLLLTFGLTHRYIKSRVKILDVAFEAKWLYFVENSFTPMDTRCFWEIDNLCGIKRYFWWPPLNSSLSKFLNSPNLW